MRREKSARVVRCVSHDRTAPDVENLLPATTLLQEASGRGAVTTLATEEGSFMETNTVNGSHPWAGKREWLGLAVLALPTLLIALDIGVLFLALPHLSADLGASATQQLWIMDIYGFMLAGFLVTMGTLVHDQATSCGMVRCS